MVKRGVTAERRRPTRRAGMSIIASRGRAADRGVDPSATPRGALLLLGRAGAGSGLAHGRDRVDRRRDRLNGAARPANLYRRDRRVGAEGEMDALRALAGVPVAAVHLVDHRLVAGRERHAGPDGVAIRFRTHELEGDPVT